MKLEPTIYFKSLDKLDNFLESESCFLEDIIKHTKE